MSQESDAAFYESEYRQALQGLRHYTHHELLFAPSLISAGEELREVAEAILKRQAPSCTPKTQEPAHSDEAPQNRTELPQVEFGTTAAPKTTPTAQDRAEATETLKKDDREIFG